MRTTQKRRPRPDLLHPASVLIFAAVAVLWVVIAVLPDWDAFIPRAAARLAGYVAFVAMLVPYLHILRRCFRYRAGWQMTWWLRLHIGAAYLAFLMVLIHSRGRATEPLTLALQWLTWAVMVSGVVGFYGQKLLYLVMPRMVRNEYGMERLEPQRTMLLARAEELNKKKDLQQGEEIVRAFCATAISACLAEPFSFWGLFVPPRSHDLISRNGYERSRGFADEPQRKLLDELWGLVEARRDMDLEYRMHTLGRLWLLIHGPAAWALLVLMVEHIAMSLWYGGW